MANEHPDVPETRRDLLAQGFKGLHTVEALLAGQYAAAPDANGIYAVFRLADPAPRFAASNAAARVKGDPTIPVPVLQAAWVPEAALLYVSKGASLRTRVRMLVEFGNGKMVQHWGGRALWQLSDADDLVVAWRAVDDAKGEEAALLQAFEAKYGVKPWANQLDKA